MSSSAPPNKKRKLNEINETKDTETSENDTCLLYQILNHNIDKLFGNTHISDQQLEQLSTKLTSLQKEISIRLSHSNTLSLEQRLKKSIHCTRAYVGDGDGNIDYESHFCKSEGVFLIGPNQKEMTFSFSAGQSNGGTILQGGISLGNIWSIDDIEDDAGMELWYSRKNAQQLMSESGYNFDDKDTAIDNFITQLTVICLQKFREKAKQHWRGGIDINFDFDTLWENKHFDE